MKSRHSSGLTSVPVAIISTVTAMRGVVVVSELGEDRFRIFFDLLLGVAYRRASTASAGLREF